MNEKSKKILVIISAILIISIITCIFITKQNTKKSDNMPKQEISKFDISVEETYLYKFLKIVDIEDYSLYTFGLEEVEIEKDSQKYSIKNFFEENQILLQDFIKSINENPVEEIVEENGTLYNYNNYNIIIDEKNIIIGSKKLTFEIAQNLKETFKWDVTWDEEEKTACRFWIRNENPEDAKFILEKKYFEDEWACNHDKYWDLTSIYSDPNESGIYWLRKIESDTNTNRYGYKIDLKKYFNNEKNQEENLYRLYYVKRNEELELYEEFRKTNHNSAEYYNGLYELYGVELEILND